MKQYFLTEIETRDNLIHQGIYFEPKKKSEVAILWVHGLSGEFHSHIATIDAFASRFDDLGYGFASFNTRGAKFIDGVQKRDPSNPKGFIYIPGGAGNEIFGECMYDIDAGIAFLAQQGYEKIFLVGHSTGANKVCFYVGTVDDPRVFGVVLNSPISDRLEKSKKEIAETLVLMKQMILEGKGDELLFGYSHFPMTAKRYLSLYEIGSKEDVFDYGDKQPKLTAFSNITKPLYVILGEKDEHADRRVVDIKKVFDAHTKSKKYSSIVVPGALHGFDGMEKKLADLIGAWIDCNV
jgi:dienelactone hydrolase